ncbi:MAG TPA: DUF1565 domain-containing protein, partial [Thermoanaerobaculia bacterium]|nr:DUF1565 domain-containing protein [Thermoanaerobaculia bacterium]
MYRRALAKPSEWGILRRVVGMALVAFLLTGALTLPEVWAATYYVNNSSGSNGNPGTSASPWKTLSYALSHSLASGDVVSVAPGTYNSANGENYPLALQDGVKIEGQNKATTILSAPVTTDVFENIDTALSSNTTLTGFTLKHDASTTYSQTLVHLQPSSVTMNPVIDDNVFQSDGSGDDVGIWIDTDSNAPGPRTFNGTISNNTFDGFDDAISLEADLEAAGTGTFNPTISGNTFTNNDEGVDFYVDAQDTLNGDGIDLTASPKIVNNQGNGNYEDIYVNADIESGNVTTAPLISGNTFSDSTDHSISLSYETMEADQSSGLNTVSPTVTNNSITNAGGDGIYVYLYEAYTGSLKTNVTLTGNTVTKPSDDGIYLSYSAEYYPQGSQSQIVATVANNTVSNAGSSGISISGSSFDNTMILGNSTVTVAGNSVDQTGSSGSTGI